MRILRLFPIDRASAERAAAVIASIPRGTIVALFAFAAILAADAVLAVLLWDPAR